MPAEEQRAIEEAKPKRDPLFWIGSSRKDLRAFPDDVKDVIGFALDQAQLGKKHVSAKPLKGFGGAGVLEIVEDHDTNTYRSVYTVKFKGAVYLLDAFQKKSKKGAETPQQDDQEAAKGRRRPLQATVAGPIGRTHMPSIKKSKKIVQVKESSGNVFHDLGLRDPAERHAKAQLANRICEVIASRDLTQTEAAKLMNLDQPRVSALIRGKLSGFSLERLFRCLNDLGQDVRVTVQPARGRQRAGMRILLA